MIERLEVVAARLARIPGPFQKAAQPEVGLGESRMSGEDGGVTLGGSSRIARLLGAGPAELIDDPPPFLRRHTGRDRGPAGLISRLIRRGHDQDRSGADLLAIGDDRLQTPAEIGQDVGRLRRAAQGRVDEL